MRMPRIRIKGRQAIYHCMSRIVGGTHIFNKREKEVFRRQMWKVAEFCGIRILSHSVMSNHYHMCIEVPASVRLRDAALLRRVERYYGEESQQAVSLRNALERGGSGAEEQKAHYLGMMGDMSTLQKLIKQRFSIWFNDVNKRCGTLWMERYKSVLVEDIRDALMSVSAYIDLNPLRAGLVRDPAAYPFSGYGAAVLGDARCRRGIIRATGCKDWRGASRSYRKFVLGRGAVDSKGNGMVVDPDLLRAALERDGELPLSELLALRVRYFSDGLVMGSEAFVEGAFQEFRRHFGKSRRTGARRMRGADWGILRVARDLRLNPIG